MDKLTEICNEKRNHVHDQMQKMPENTLRLRLSDAAPLRGFSRALLSKVADGGIGLIAEIKKASPSRGVIRKDFAPAVFGQAYEAGGATCLSVLTDTPYFEGDDSYIAAARSRCGLPVLRKDFMLEPYQIIESRVLGADCALLIMAALSNAQAQELEACAHELGMDVLVEVHDEDELARALQYLKSPLLGINNRNLKTMDIDLAVTERLAPLVPSERMIVCESGIHTHDDITRMQKANAHCFLVGASLMEQEDITAATKALLGEA